MSIHIKKTVKNKVAKVPLIMQMEALECGAASLAMILAYYGKWIPLEILRDEMGVSRDGVNAESIYDVAVKHDLTVVPYTVEVEAITKDFPFPCIIHWDFNHFVVLNGFKRNKAYINDPAKGVYAVSMDVFDESFTGVCLTFSPTDKFKPEGKPKSIIEYIKERLIGSESILLFMFIIAIVSSILGVFNQAFSRIYFDRILTWESVNWFVPFMLFLFIMYVLQIVISGIEAHHILRIDGKLNIEGSSSFLWKVLNLPLIFFSQRSVGDVLVRQQSNATITKSIINLIAPLILNIIISAVYFVVMIRYSILLTLVGLSTTFINFLVSRHITNKMINKRKVMSRDMAKLSTVTLSGADMIETIKSSGAEVGFFGKWAGYQASVNYQQVENMIYETYINIIPTFLTSFLNIVILTIGVIYIINGNFTIGMLMAFQGFLASFTAPALALINTNYAIQTIKNDIERIDDVMKYPSDNLFKEVSIKDKVYEKLNGNIELIDVTFGYSKLSEPVIKNFSMKVSAGKHIAIVGASGSGKSTISKLITGLYKQWSGKILFDGKEISEIDRDIFKNSVAVVDQEITMFEDTVLNNITMWDDTIENFEVVLAARDANLHDSILKKDGGYNHKLVDGGKDFSGGERQRLEIARVLALDPIVLILDEATSALDAKTEYEIVKAINERGITCITIAHRLSTIRDCDEIIVLNEGVIVECGKHDDLIKQKGYYANLIQNE